MLVMRCWVRCLLVVNGFSRINTRRDMKAVGCFVRPECLQR